MIASHAAGGRDEVEAVFVCPDAAVGAMEHFVFVHDSALVALGRILDDALAVLVNGGAFRGASVVDAWAVEDDLQRLNKNNDSKKHPFASIP